MNKKSKWYSRVLLSFNLYSLHISCVDIFVLIYIVFLIIIVNSNERKDFEYKKIFIKQQASRAFFYTWFQISHGQSLELASWIIYPKRISSFWFLITSSAFSAMVTIYGQNIKIEMKQGYSFSIRWKSIAIFYFKSIRPYLQQWVLIIIETSKIQYWMVIPQVLDENRFLFFILSRFVPVLSNSFK